MSATPTPKVLVTKGLQLKFIRIAEARYIRRGKRNPHASLTNCRDFYWKNYAHFYRRVGKACARVLYTNHAGQVLRANDYDGFARYLDSLDDHDIQTAIDRMKSNLNLNPVVQRPVTPPPQPTTPTNPGQGQGQGQGQGGEDDDDPNAPDDPAYQHGTNNQQMTDGGGGSPSAGGGGEKFTSIIPDRPPAGFNYSAVKLWAQSSTLHEVNTDRQGQMQAKLRQALMSVSQCRVTRDLDDGDLDMDRLVDIGSGTNLSGLFSHTRQGRHLSVATQIYADVSGSMSGGPNSSAEWQLTLCLALGSVLEKLRIPVQIIAYDDTPYLVKCWNTKIRNSMVMKMPLAMGGTNMPQTLAAGFPALAARREERHLACIISDGDIGCEGREPDMQLHDSQSGKSWVGRPPPTLKLRKQYPRVETCFFGIGAMDIPDIAFDYKITGLGKNIIEVVSNTVVKIIVGKDRTSR